MKYYKVLGKGRTACNGGNGKWPRPGTWLEAEGPLVPCHNGLHLCRLQDLVSWINEEIWEVEPAPGTETIVCDDKVVVRKARLVRQIKKWNNKTVRLFVIDCAERVLPIFEKKYPDDNRPRKAIEAARKYENGKITKKELAAARAAARDAARDAVWAAARDAARDAAWAAAWAAAWDAARDAVWAAARDAARDAAWAAERKWQTERLAYYLGIEAGEGA